jgi:glutathione peroxidase
MKKTKLGMAGFLALFVAFSVTSLSARMFERSYMRNVYDLTVQDIDGKDVKLGDFRGKVLLIVNVASRCGYTPQYDGLQKIYEEFKDRGFVVLGFPANNFGAQEPGTNDEIKAFCSTEYHVTFPMFSKISVAGEDQHPLYRFLTMKQTNPDHSGEITWNFNKFLIGKNGEIVRRFDSDTQPESPAMRGAIERALKEKAKA